MCFLQHLTVLQGSSDYLYMGSQQGKEQGRKQFWLLCFLAILWIQKGKYWADMGFHQEKQRGVWVLQKPVEMTPTLRTMGHFLIIGLTLCVFSFPILVFFLGLCIGLTGACLQK